MTPHRWKSRRRRRAATRQRGQDRPPVTHLAWFTHLLRARTPRAPQHPVYDPRVEDATTPLARAETAHRTQQRRPRHGAAGIAAWARVQHWSRLAHAQAHHLHWWYLHTETSAVCTCGLLHELPAPPVQEVPGHRDPRDWSRTPLLVVHAPPPATATECADAQEPLPDRAARYLVLCQSCGYRSRPLPLAEAGHARASHTRASHARAGHTRRAMHDPHVEEAPDV